MGRRLGRRRRRTGHSCPKRAPSVAVEARRRVSRCGPETANLGGGGKTRSLAKHEERGSLCEARQVERTDRSIDCRGLRRFGAEGKAIILDDPKGALEALRARHKRYLQFRRYVRTDPLASIARRIFLEIFPGSGHLGAAIENLGGLVLLWDISLGPNSDLTFLHNRQLLRGWGVSSGLLWGSHAGTPCNTFSMARAGRPGPLRSRERKGL